MSSMHLFQEPEKVSVSEDEEARELEAICLPADCPSGQVTTEIRTESDWQTRRHPSVDDAVLLHCKPLPPLSTTHAQRWSSFTDRAGVLFGRFQRTVQLSDLDEAISLYREALILRPAPHPDRTPSLNNLAATLQTRFEHAGQRTDLDEAVLLFREAVILWPALHPDRPSSLTNLAVTLLTRFDQMGELSDLDEAILLHREAVALRPVPHPDRPTLLNNLATGLHTRFQQTGQPPDLDEAVSLHRESLNLRAPSDPHRATSLINLASVLYTQFCQTGQLLDLNEAVSLHREALVLQPAPHPDHGSSLDNLGVILVARFEQTSELSDLEEAVSLHRDALSLRPAPHPDRPFSLDNLARALHTRVEETGQFLDLEEVVSLHREALDLRPAPHPHRATSLVNLAIAILTRFRQTGQLPDMNEAISRYHEALILLPAHHTKLSFLLNNLAEALETRFEQTAQLPDLDEAVLLHRKTLTLRTAQNPHQASSFVNLAVALHTRFEYRGHIPDLDEAILLHRKGLALQPSPHLNRFASLNGLAMTLHTRFEHTAQLSDLDEAILLHREALALRPAPHPDCSFSLNSLAMALNTRFKHTGQLPDLDEAITLHRKDLHLRHAYHPGRSSSLNNLAMALHTRFEHRNELPDLDEAVLLFREALVLLPAHNVNRSLVLSNFANIFQTRLQFSHQLSDVEEAITLCRQSLQALPPEHPRVCHTSLILGRLFRDRFCCTPESVGATGEQANYVIEKQTQDLLRAVDAFRTAAHCESALVSERFVAAWEWAALSDASVFPRGSSLEAHEAAISLLPRLAMLGVDLQSRQKALAFTDGLARDAAACAIEQQKIEKAVEFLEEGRTIFWSQALQLRTPLDELQSLAPELVQRLKSISRELEQGALRDVSRTMSEPLEKVMLMERDVIRYRQLNAEWLAAVEEVRTLDGFQDFLRAKSFATLSVAATNGPVVILNAGEQKDKCAALVMRLSQDPVHIPLPAFTLGTAEKLIERIRTLPDATFPLARSDPDRHSQRFYPNGRDPDSIFREVLGTLWRSVVQPIFCCLNMEKSESPPRLWWLPTGPFASLPIHAAGIYDAPGRECVGDYVISSYTPTLSALLTPLPLVGEPFKMLAAIQPATKGQAPLPCTVEELRKIEGHVPHKCLRKFGIPKAPANIRDILSDLPTASIVHLACHGIQDPKNPLDSALLLEDGHLKILELMQLSMPSASLVFLSACQTAMVNEDLPDESMHLAATLLFSGFRGAVATMWSIKDRDGPTIADHFYHHLFSTLECANKGHPSTPPDTTRAAQALHMAVVELRDKLHAEQAPSQFVRWVPFIHLGL